MEIIGRRPRCSHLYCNICLVICVRQLGAVIFKKMTNVNDVFVVPCLMCVGVWCVVWGCSTLVDVEYEYTVIFVFNLAKYGFHGSGGSHGLMDLHNFKIGSCYDLLASREANVVYNSVHCCHTIRRNCSVILDTRWVYSRKSSWYFK